MGPITIKNDSSVSLYEQIANQIKGHILSGRLKQGEALPSIRALAKDLQVSIITTKRAYEELEGQGFLTTVAGKGTFVAVENQQRLLDMRICEIERFLEQAAEAAKSISMGKRELLEILSILYDENNPR